VTERLRRLAARIRQELTAIDRVTIRIARAWAAARRHSTDQDLYLDSVALCLHDFYTGVERIFRHVAAGFDESMPGGSDWHDALLRQMATERLPDRPAVIAARTREGLEEYLRFRHVVRNIYAFEFDAERLGRLVDTLPDVFQRVRGDRTAFSGFLDQMISDDGSSG